MRNERARDMRDTLKIIQYNIVLNFQNSLMFWENRNG